MLNLNQHILTKFCIHPQVARKISELTESPSTDLRETFITWNDLASLKLKPWQYAGTQKERIVSQPPRFRGKLLDLQIYGACSFSLTRLTFITLKRYPPWNYHITPESHSSLFLFFCNSTPEIVSWLEDGHFLGSFGPAYFLVHLPEGDGTRSTTDTPESWRPEGVGFQRLAPQDFDQNDLVR